MEQLFSDMHDDEGKDEATNVDTFEEESQSDREADIPVPRADASGGVVPVLRCDMCTVNSVQDRCCTVVAPSPSKHVYKPYSFVLAVLHTSRQVLLCLVSGPCLGSGACLHSALQQYRRESRVGVFSMLVGNTSVYWAQRR
jgi:hypothetical protein